MFWLKVAKYPNIAEELHDFGLKHPCVAYHPLLPKTYIVRKGLAKLDRYTHTHLVDVGNLQSYLRVVFLISAMGVSLARCS